VNQFGATRDVPAGTSSRFDGADSSVSEKRTVTDPSTILTIIGTITSQAVLITALFYYFGRVYARSFFDYFGVDLSMIDYSTADYVLRSINVAFRPFIYATFAVLAVFCFHRLVMVTALMRTTPGSSSLSNTATTCLSGSATPRFTRTGLSRAVGSAAGSVQTLGRWRLGPSGARWIIAVLWAVAVVFMAVAFAGVLLPERFGAPLGLFLPLLLILSVGLLGYVAHVRLRYPNALTAAMPPAPVAASRVYPLTLLTLGFVAALWSVSIYGDYVGMRFATDIAAQLSARPGVVIYSTERIALNGPGIDVGEIAQPGAKYHYQYTGLRLLVRSSDKLLLLPAKWQRGRDRVLLLRDDNSIRIDLVART
jgi:hypothetical protein